MQQHFEIKSAQINKLRETKSPDPYSRKFDVDAIANLQQYLQKYESLAKEEKKPDVTARVAGRICNKRGQGPKLFFYDIGAEEVKVQVICQAIMSKIMCRSMLSMSIYDKEMSSALSDFLVRVVQRTA
jgi:lysyl-tRNA synthetase, class II